VTVASPCIGLCAVDENRICRGCHRTLGEIASWSLASDEQKRRILLAARQRAGRPDPHISDEHPANSSRSTRN